MHTIHQEQSGFRMVNQLPLRSTLLYAITLAGRLTISTVGLVIPLHATDCNKNGIDDVEDLRPGALEMTILPPIHADGNFKSMVSEDFDGDGLPDFAVIDGDAIKVYFNIGNTMFQSPAVIHGTDIPELAVASDINMDGQVDIVIGNSKAIDKNLGSLSIMNNRNGLFDESKRVWEGDRPLSIICFDLNEDSAVDIVTTNNIANSAWLLLNKGNGAFDGGHRLANTGGPTNIIAANFDDRNGFDLAIVNGEASSVSILLNDGHAEFSTDTKTYPVGDEPLRAIALDLNYDGWPEIVSANFASRNVSVLLNNGDGTFQPSLTYMVGRQPHSIVGCDFDGDNEPDVATANHDPGISVLKGFLDGTLGAADSYDTKGVPTIFGEVVAADFNGDLMPDLAVGTEEDGGCDSPCNGAVAILANIGKGSFADAASIPLQLSSSHLIAEDFDRDKKTDLAVFTYDFDSEFELLVLLLNATRPPIALDLNQNGVPDSCDSGAYHRGDVNSDGTVNLSDAVFILVYLFQAGPEPECLDAANSNSDKAIDLADSIFLLSFLFAGGDSPGFPGAPPASCGIDWDSETLGCEHYSMCE